jgi:hypothetical protein
MGMSSFATWSHLALVVIAACATAVMFRRLRAPGPAVLGGIVTGVLLGPSIAGRIAPTAYERTVIGAVAEREALDAIDAEHHAYTVAADAARIGIAERERARVAWQLERAPAAAALEAARRAHAEPWRLAMLIAVALVMLGTSAVREPLGAPPAKAAASLPGAASIGLWSAALPAGAMLLVLWLLGRSPTTPAALATAAAVAIGPWVLTSVDLQAADEAESGGGGTVRLAGRIATLCAIGGFAAATLAARGPTGLVAAAPVAALAAGWMVPTSAGHRGAGAIVSMIVVPALTALLAVRIELFAHMSVWLLIAACIISGDARWLGATTGALLPGGRRVLRTMRLVLGSMAAGVTQIAVAATALATGLIDEPIAYALLAGAAVIELGVPARRRAAARFVEMEAALDEGEP